MQLNRLLFWASLAVAAFSLAFGFCLVHQLWLAAAVLLPVGEMLLARHPARAGWASLSLAGFAALAAVGVVLQLPMPLMVLACTAALVSWDLLLEAHPRRPGDGSAPGGSAGLRWKSLGAVVALALLGAGFGFWVHWRIPFIGMVILVIAILFCLDRALHAIQ